MKVKVFTSTDRYDERFRFRDGEPEDANLLRDFNDCYAIPDIIKLAYEAGKNGEDFSIEITKEEW